MVRVYVARHGETTWNLAGRYQGRRESGLTALGVRQGFALADAFARNAPRIERIIASPLLRCSATAKFVADRLNLPLEHDDRLLEIAHGTWEGRLRDEIAAEDAERFRRWKELPADVGFEGGETLVEVCARWQRFAASFDAARPTLVVTHDAIVRVAILAAQERSLDELWRVSVENAGFAEFSVDTNSSRIVPAAHWTLVYENVNDHLTGLHAAQHTQAL
jgi:broad specificity phosphatase PhoE